jgi:hypothetical protein
MTTIQHLLRTLILTSIFLLAACGKKAPDGPSSPTLERAALMQLAFPGWSAKGATHDQKLFISGKLTGTSDKQGQPMDEVSNERVDPAFVVRLSDDDATLVIRENRIDVNGNIADCNACTVEYGSIQFHRYDDRWYLSNRQDVFTDVGSMGAGDSREIVKLSQHAYALKLGSYAMNMGEENNVVDLYELTPDGPHALLGKGGIYLSGNNEDAVASCSEPPLKDRNKPLFADDQSDCYRVESKWKLDATGETPGDLILEFSGFIRIQDQDKQYRYHHVDSRQTWHYQGGKYVVASGINPMDQVGH